MPAAPATKTGTLRAVNVVKRFGAVTALDAVSIDVAAGACLALVGESGSGKTTLLRCFNRMIEPDAGTVFVDDLDVAAANPVELRRHLGYVPQDGGLIPHWRVERNVELVLRLTGSPDANSHARDALTLVGLPPATFADRWPRDLSGGQRQRVAIARALAARPRVLLMDEPFGALDAITRADLQESFVALRREIGMTCLLVTHDLHEAMRVATQIAVLRGGRLEQVDAPAALMARPATPYVSRLLERAGVLRPSTATVTA